MRETRTVRFVLLALCLCLLPALPLFAGAIPVGPNIQITDVDIAEPGADSPDIAVVGNTVYAVWKDWRNYEFGGTGDVYFAKSTDDGVNWSANKRITQPGHRSAYDPVSYTHLTLPTKA